MKTMIIVALAAGAFAISGCESEGIYEKCIVTATGNELCGESADSWCDMTDEWREGDYSSQAVCDSVRED